MLSSFTFPAADDRSGYSSSRVNPVRQRTVSVNHHSRPSRNHCISSSLFFLSHPRSSSQATKTSRPKRNNTFSSGCTDCGIFTHQIAQISFADTDLRSCLCCGMFSQHFFSGVMSQLKVCCPASPNKRAICVLFLLHLADHFLISIHWSPPDRVRWRTPRCAISGRATAIIHDNVKTGFLPLLRMPTSCIVYDQTIPFGFPWGANFFFRLPLG